MAHFAKVIDNKVTEVIVAEQDFIDTLPDKEKWIQTSFNTFGGVHKLGGTPMRKNYAGIGYTYNKAKDAFIAPKPFPSFILDDVTCLWNAPVPYPEDGLDYTWNEGTLSWVKTS